MSDANAQDCRIVPPPVAGPVRGRGHHLTPAQRRHTMKKAARLVWSGRLRGAAIAAACGVSRRTLVTWQGQARFQALVATERDNWLAGRERERAAEMERSLADSTRRSIARVDAQLARFRRSSGRR